MPRNFAINFLNMFVRSTRVAVSFRIATLYAKGVPDLDIRNQVAAYKVMPTNIRAATPADVPLILNFIRELAAYEKLSAEVTATERQLEHTLFGSPPAAECLLAFQDAQPAGFAIYFQNYSTFLAQPGLHLEDLYVKPEYRGQGIGKALLLHVAQTANARKCGRMEWTVLDWNQPAIGFYESLGARQLTDWTICRLAGPALQRYA